MSEQHGKPHSKQGGDSGPCMVDGKYHERDDSRKPVDIENWPAEPGDDDYEGRESEYLVDIDTHHSILIVARSVDEAAAKALGPLADGQTTVAHDVHVCVHSGISDNECDHKDGDGEETD